MGYDYRKKLLAEGQHHSNACWAASLSWWTAAMSLHYKRTTYPQTELIVDFQDQVSLGGGVNAGDLRKVAESAKIRMELKFIPLADLTKYTFDTPCIVVFDYPQAGGTHMNVVFDRQGDTVMCMEPFFPISVPAGEKRKGTYIRRPLNFFTTSSKIGAQIGIGYLPTSDMTNGTTGSY